MLSSLQFSEWVSESRTKRSSLIRPSGVANVGGKIERRSKLHRTRRRCNGTGGSGLLGIALTRQACGRRINRRSNFRSGVLTTDKGANIFLYIDVAFEIQNERCQREARSDVRDPSPPTVAGRAPRRPARGRAADLPRGVGADQFGRPNRRLERDLAGRAPLPGGPLALSRARGRT